METTQTPKSFNSETEISLRKSMRELLAAGEAIITFGAWTSLKVFISSVFGEMGISSYIDMSLDVPASIQYLMVLITFGIICSIAMSLHLFAGLGAMREGRGKKGGYVYLVFNFILCVFSITSIYHYIVSIIRHTVEGSILTLIVSIMFELTILCIVFDIYRSCFRVRRLKKQLQKEASNEQ